MTPNTVQPITDEQLAEIERFLGFGGAMLKTKREAWLGVIARLRAAEKDQARYLWLRDSADSAEGTAPMAVMVDECCRPAFDTSGYAHSSARKGYELDEAIDAAMHQG